MEERFEVIFWTLRSFFGTAVVDFYMCGGMQRMYSSTIAVAKKLCSIQKIKQRKMLVSLWFRYILFPIHAHVYSLQSLLS